MDVGAALWTQQSTALDPANLPAAYQRIVDDARLVEELGFSTLWFAEHRFWYDAWTPSPLMAAAAAAGATTRLRVGTAMLLLPQRDAAATARSTAQLHRTTGGRLDLGVGLGYRDEEFDGLGIARTRRGRRMEDGLETMYATWEDEAAEPPPVWMGGMARPALERGARWGLNFMLPPTLYDEEVAAAVARIRDTAAEVGTTSGRIGIVKDVWVDEDADHARSWFLPRLAQGYKEYGAWWIFKDRFPGFERPDLVDRQIERSLATAIVGDPDDVVQRLQALDRAGVDHVALHLNRAATRPHLRRALRLAATAVLPRLSTSA